MTSVTWQMESVRVTKKSYEDEGKVKKGKDKL
jgi:hypothetical protein